MGLDSSEFSLRRARLLTLLVVVAVSGIIALLNLSSEPLTAAFLEDTVFVGKSAERAYGWPLVWYRRSKSVFSAPRWSVSRYDALQLMGNVALWLAMLAAASAICEWLLRRYRPRLQFRPRLAAVPALMAVSALIALANLSFDDCTDGLWHQSHYGWPLIWYWHFDLVGPPSAFYREWDHSAAALAGNVTIWLMMLVATGIVSQWLLDRYGSGPRWSLRSLLAIVALVAALCAWCVTLRNRADDQDVVVESFRGEGDIQFERGWPKWLDVLGAERFCRRIVLVHLAVKYTERRSEEYLNSFKRLARLPDLRCLCIEPDTHPRWPVGFVHQTAAALSGMQQLQMLDLECQPRFPYSHRTFDAAHQYLAAIGKLKRLERLRVCIWAENSDDLAYLCNLTNLKTLALNIMPIDNEVGERPGDDGPHVLARLPALPGLEELDLHEACIGDDDLVRLAAFPQLKSLDLCGTRITDAGLARLVPLELLEELAIDERMATATGFEALVGLKRLRKIHISIPKYGDDGPAAVRLDDGQTLTLSTRELGEMRRALRHLRESHRGVVVDGNYDEFAIRADLRAPWDYDDHGATDGFRQRWFREH